MGLLFCRAIRFDVLLFTLRGHTDNITKGSFSERWCDGNMAQREVSDIDKLQILIMWTIIMKW
jgi:hypothetical protein